MKLNYLFVGFLALCMIAAFACDGFAARVVSWQFDETEGLVANDSSGNGFDGTLGAGFSTAVGYWQPGAGRTGLTGDGALYCDGSADMSVIATVADANSIPNGAGNIFLGTSSWTINLWIKFDGPAEMVNIGGFGDCEWDTGTVGQTDRYFAAFGNYAGYEFERGDDGFWPSDSLDDGTWKMLTVTYDGTTQEGLCYLNGEFKSSKIVALADTEEDAFKINSFGFIIWEDDDGTPRTWAKAWYDDYSIWDEVFLARHVKGMYEGTFTSCDGAIVSDMNGDCVVGMEDFAIVAADWLECNILPASMCD